MNFINNSSLDLLHSPSKTSAIIFLIDKPTKSVLLFNDNSGGLTGYLFTDETGDKAIKATSISKFYSSTNISILEQNPLCSNIIEITSDNQIYEWRFVILVTNFKIPNSHESNGIPSDSKWFNRNQIIKGKIKCKEERGFLINYLQNL